MPMLANVARGLREWRTFQPPMIALSAATRLRVTALFRAEDAETAERLLADECGDNLPLVGEAATPVSLERIRFAAIRMSDGDLEHLRRAIELAQTDWRDLLVAANFADDPGAHQRWRPRRSAPGGRSR
jgi:hypothetical protein